MSALATVTPVPRPERSKTTIILAVLGLLPSGTSLQGSITLAGEQLVGMPARRRRELLGDVIGFVPQDPFVACDPLRPVRDHLLEAWRARRRWPGPTEVDELLAAVGLDPARAGQRPHQWSGGMLQRATIAAATAHKPALIVADEPTSALDVFADTERSMQGHRLRRSSVRPPPRTPGSSGHSRNPGRSRVTGSPHSAV